LATEPSGENRIVMFKSCFPNSDLRGNSSDPVPSIGDNPLKGQDSSSEHHTIANAKGIYIDLLEYFRTRTDKPLHRHHRTALAGWDLGGQRSRLQQLARR